MLKEEGFGEGSRVNWERGMRSDVWRMIFVSVCDEMMPFADFGW